MRLPARHQLFPDTTHYPLLTHPFLAFPCRFLAVYCSEFQTRSFVFSSLQPISAAPPEVGSPLRGLGGSVANSAPLFSSPYELLFRKPFVFTTICVAPGYGPPPRFRRHDSCSDADEISAMFSTAYALFGKARSSNPFGVSSLRTLAGKAPGVGVLCKSRRSLQLCVIFCPSPFALSTFQDSAHCSLRTIHHSLPLLASFVGARA